MTQATPQPMKIAGMTGRAVILVLAVLTVAAALPLVLTNYQVGLATEMLIFGVLAMSIDILAGFAGRTSLGHGAIFGVSGYVVVYAVRAGRIAACGWPSRSAWSPRRWSR